MIMNLQKQHLQNLKNRKTNNTGLHGPMDKALVYGTRDSVFDPQ